MKKKILVTTPISHIKNFKEKLYKNFIVDLDENINQKNLLKKVKNYDVIFTNPNMSKVFFSKKVIEKAKKLKIICTASTGQNHIDIKSAMSADIEIVSLRDKLHIINKISSTAELSIALMFASIRNIIPAFNDVIKGGWNYLPFIGKQINYLTVGIIGYGRLGKMFVKMIKPFTKNILIFDRYVKIKGSDKKYQVSLNKLLRDSDIISLHIHADKSNNNFIEKKKLKKLKKDVLIVNTSRGEVVNETDLLFFLKKNKNSRYATDVIKNEIMGKKQSKILNNIHKNNQIIVTPHIGGMTIHAQEIAYGSVLNILIKKIRQH